MPPLNAWLDQRRHPLVVFTAAALAVFLLNVALHSLRWRGDFSRGGIYSVSQASSNFLRSLPEPVTAEVYASRDLPPDVAARRDYLLDLLDELADGSGGRLKVVRRGVETPSESDRASRAGIPRMRLDSVQHGKYEAREARLGLNVIYRGHNDAIPFVSDAAGLEYEVMSRVRGLVAGARRPLGFAVLPGTMSSWDLPDSVRRRLEDHYEPVAVKLSSAATYGFPAGVKTLVVVGVDRKFEAAELYAMDRFLSEGGAILLALDPKKVDLRSFVGVKFDVGISTWLAAKGVLAPSRFVYDLQNVPIEYEQKAIGRAAAQTNFVQYPALIAATSLASGHPATTSLGSVMMPFGGPLILNPPPGLTATALVRSSRYAWLVGDPNRDAVLAPDHDRAPAPGETPGSFILAAAVEGNFASAMMPVPKGIKARPSGVAAPGRLVVVSTARFTDPRFRPPMSNFVFFLNLIDWLSAQPDLLAIRAKTLDFSPLREVTAPTRAAIGWVLMLVPPFFAVLGGLVAWSLRLARRAELRRVYGVRPAAGHS